MKTQYETTQAVIRITEISKMGEDSLSGLQRADERKKKALELWNEGMITGPEAIAIARG